MLHMTTHGPVRKLIMARAFFGRSFYHTAAYWVDGLLIDSGCAFSARELLEATRRFPIARIVNTHCHEEHIGGNGLLQRERGADIAAHPLALPVLADPRRQYLQLYRRVFWGWPQPSRGEPLGDWIETEHYRFQVIPTPGHSPDHIALFEPREGWLFSGDAFIGGQDRAARPDYDMYAIIGSLRRMAALDPALLFPGSGTVRERPAEELQRKIASLEELGEKVRRLHEEGLPVETIRRRLLGPEAGIRWLTLGHFKGEHLIRAFLRDAQAPA